MCPVFADCADYFDRSDDVAASNAYVVYCAKRTKNLERYLLNKSSLSLFL